MCSIVSVLPKTLRKLLTSVMNIFPTRPPRRSVYWKSNYKSWLYSKFPEELYPCAPDKVEEYNEQVLAGLRIMGQSEVSICGLARNLAHILPLNIYRIEQIASLFGFAKIYVYEN